MRTKIHGIILILLFCFTTLLFSTTYDYPGDDPVLSIMIPNTWTVEPEDEILHASPKDESIYVGLWALGDADELDAAFEALDEELADVFSELEFGDAEELEINGLTFIGLDGTGVSDGVQVDISVAVFTPDDETLFIFLYFGTEEAETEHEDDLMDILYSIRAVQ